MKASFFSVFFLLGVWVPAYAEIESASAGSVHAETELLAKENPAGESLSSAHGSSRLKIKDLEHEILGIDKLILRYAGSAEQVLVGQCLEDQKLESAHCEAHSPSAMLGFSRHEEKNRVILTSTQILGSDKELKAECRAINLRFDETVRLTMSLHCSPAALNAALLR